MSVRSHQPSAISHQRLAGKVGRWLAIAGFVAAGAPALSVPGSLFPVPGLYAQDTGLPVGSKAPASVAVETLDGKPFDLGQYIGKTPVLLEFWATWCPNCKQLEPAMLEASKKYADKIKFVAVAVSVNQSPQRVKLHVEKHGLPMEVYYDRKGNAADAFDAAATSYIIVLDKSGTVVYTGLGGTQNIDAAIRKALGG
ncbi:MAG: Redoxin domain protein [Geminicoccaceae bacterium]|jgi:thiol-disulfide isomerase/thioredoxin|nr:Redoxin domain protein [Geminicoccaceae bacterium]